MHVQVENKLWRLKLHRGFWILATLAVFCGFADPGHAASKLAFSWKGNSDADLVGYRLYYGAESRYNSQGQEKANFNYPRYLDLGDWTRCDGYTNNCTPISNGVTCSNLDGSQPKCAIGGMAGTLFFTLTAYSQSTESGYTYEIKVRLNRDGTVASANDFKRIMTVNRISTLLLNDRK